MTLPYNLGQMTLRAPRSLPSALQVESSTKLIWLWLRPQGEVTHSRRDIAEILGMPLSGVQIAFRKLEELGLLEHHGEALPRTKRRYSVLAVPKEKRVSS